MCDLACGPGSGTAAEKSADERRKTRRLDRCTNHPQDATDRAVQNCLAGRFPLAQGLGEAVDKRVEISVLLSQLFDLPDGVDDGRVMFPTEAPTNLRERCARQVLAEIHCDLARHG